MADYYYLVSSLPMIREEEAPSITTEAFLDMCASWLSEDEMQQLKELSLVPESEKQGTDAFSLWNTWEICLRNRLARARSADTGTDPDDYMLHEADWFSEIDRGVQEALAMTNPLEREKLLDHLRWTRLDDMESGHSFDFDKICIYKLKLMLTEKWTERKTDQGNKNLTEIIDKIYLAAGTEQAASSDMGN